MALSVNETEDDKKDELEFISLSEVNDGETGPVSEKPKVQSKLTSFFGVQNKKNKKIRSKTMSFL